MIQEGMNPVGGLGTHPHNKFGWLLSLRHMELLTACFPLGLCAQLSYTEGSKTDASGFPGMVSVFRDSSCARGIGGIGRCTPDRCRRSLAWGSG